MAQVIKVMMPRYHPQSVRAARTVSGIFGAYLHGLGDVPPDVALSTIVQPDGLPVGSGAQTNTGTGAPMPLPATAGDASASQFPSWYGASALGFAAARGAAIGGAAAGSWRGAGIGAALDGGLAGVGTGLAYAMLGDKSSTMKALLFGGLGAVAIGTAIVMAYKSRRH